MLTLKEKLQLFKLAKKPRKQIKLRLEVITNSLNLPSLHKTAKQLYNSSSEKHQKVISNIDNFKKIDNTKHNIINVSKSGKSTPKSKENLWSMDQQSLMFDKVLSRDQASGSLQRSRRKLYNSNCNASFLLSDFDFSLTRQEKKKKQAEARQSVSKENYSYLEKERRKESIQLIKLKNEYNALMNMNRLYKEQWQNAKKIEKIAWNANRMSQVMMRSEDLKQSLKM